MNIEDRMTLEAILERLETIDQRLTNIESRLWVDENDERISLRGWLRSLFSKPPPPPMPGTVAWIAAKDAARIRGKIAKHLARESPPFSHLSKNDNFEDWP